MTYWEDDGHALRERGAGRETFLQVDCNIAPATCRRAHDLPERHSIVAQGGPTMAVSLFRPHRFETARRDE
jgi:hypothetical protein